MKIDKHIEIVSSSIVELSSVSMESRTAIRDALGKYYTNVSITIVDKLSDLEALVARQPDLVFLGMKFIPRRAHLGIHDPQKIWITQYLEDHGILYTGSGQQAHNLELDKPLAKQRVLDAGLRTSLFFVTGHEYPLLVNAAPLHYPLFVKPTNRGGGLGIDSDSVVHNFDNLQSKTESIILDLHSNALVEEYLPGREFSVAILKDDHSMEYSVMPIELVAAPDEKGSRLLSAEMKSSNAEVVSLITNQALRARICTLAIEVFHALGARDYGRIDIRLDEAGVAHFLEANLLPSLISGYGSFPKACEMNNNLGYESMLLQIVRLAMLREPLEIVPDFEATVA